MGLGSSLKKHWNKITNEVRDIGRQASSNLADLEDSGGTAAALGLFANPLIAQDIMGSAFAGALSRGADARTAFTQAGQSNATILSPNNPEQWKDLAAFNAALVAGAATGGAAGTLFGTSGAAFAAPGALTMGSATAAGAAAVGAGALVGGGMYAGTQALRGVTGSNSGDQGELPPDLASTYANDPNTAAQFQRLRKASRALGRAGTFKNKGAGTSLGLGDSVLGDQLSLIGS